MASTFVMVLALGGLAVGQQNAVIVLAPAEIAWGTRPDGGKISVIEGESVRSWPVHDARDRAGGLAHPPLSHPVAEHLTVLSGTIYIGKGEKFDAGAIGPCPPAASW